MTMLSQHWFEVQQSLFPHLKEEIGYLGSNHERLVSVIEISEVKILVSKRYPTFTGGRHCEDRTCIAIAFLGKHVFNLSTNSSLIDRLRIDVTLRRLCGWERKSSIPSEATFSRAFAEFSDMNLTQELLDSLVLKHHSNRLVGHINRDSTEIDAREKSSAPRKRKEKKEKSVKARGRPKKGEERPQTEKELKRLEKQKNQTVDQMLSELPKGCDYGSKKNSQGFKTTWKGYKYHIDSIDGDIPVSAILTSASVHDSQVALPLNKMTKKKITACYELMDSAYDAKIIREEISKSGRVPLIDFNRRSPKDERKFESFEKERYKNRSGAERVNSHLKDNLGARTIRVRGNSKISTHLGFGLLIIAVEQTIRLLT
jgi:hypothetical protein